VQQQQLEADNGAAQAASYLNFLLNRPLATPIEAAAMDDAAGNEAAATTSGADGGLAAAAQAARLARPELKELEQAGIAAAAQLRAARAARRPNLALGIDAGTQGADYGFGRDYNFVAASLMFSWTLFDGGARPAAVSQARVATRRLENQRSAAAQRIESRQQARQPADHARVAGGGDSARRGRARRVPHASRKRDAAWRRGRIPRCAQRSPRPS
jgi:outer membrane protein TolC